METLELAARIADRLPYLPNSQQIQLIAALARYMAGDADSGNSRSVDRVFLLNGYAGTGKTSVVGAMVKALGELGLPTVLMAPTGRAAKVLQSACNHTAYTIHRFIYRSTAEGMVSLQENKLQNALFVVDEASMIADDSADGRNLLHDLIYFVFSGVNCRLILLGDTAQLPPVGYTDSPAMNPDVLRTMGLRTTRVTVTETARQKNGSGILYNATRQRLAMALDPLPEPTIYSSPFEDIRVIEDPEDLADAVQADYKAGVDGRADTIIITRSNRRATEFNASVRRVILGYEEELTVGERLLIVKNNYHWGVKRPGLDFIANGDVAIVDRIIGTESRYGLRFADVVLYMPDRDATFECKIMLDTLVSLSASLDPDLAKRFEHEIFNDPDLFAPSTPIEQRRRTLRSNPYWQALQVKYAYCVTCHKAQGGQWRNVYVDTGYIPPEATGVELYRWLYTATTRATTRLNFIMPPFPVK